MSVALLSDVGQESVFSEFIAARFEHRQPTLYETHVKRAVDVVGAVVLLVLVLPVLLIAAAAVRLSLGPGVLFRQRRAGHGGEEFTIYKFRTMHPDRRRQ